MTIDEIKTKARERVGEAAGYAGDVAPGEAWRLLQKDPKAVLVDVRTREEWMFVGVPDLSAVGKQAILISWQIFPQMGVNPDFAADLKEAGVGADQTILFLCRSGGRSRNAAIAMTQAGFANCFNVLEGFEGDADENRHRSSVGGWKFSGLPWVQS